MLFNSYEFIFLFLPITLIVYFFLNRQRLTIASKAWLVFASLFFYSYWNIAYLPLILSSIIFNFALGTTISKERISGREPPKKLILTFGIISNILILGYFKYMDFFIGNINTAFHSALPLLHIILPLGISFFTFTQIAYLVDAYRGEVKEMDYLNYSLFVTFFPHLLAGPIIHHKEMMPQFDNIRNKVINYKNVALGLFLFSIGLFKKVVIADTFAVWANAGFSNTAALTLFEAWATSLSYTFQLYFDFSGYTDMALGIAFMFNIRLPINFNSPYKAVNIQEFWRRWHMTLSRFLREYIYIPLGGNKKGEGKTYLNLFAVFLIGGLWHGASWTFVFWGFLHGIAMVIHRAWQNMGMKMNIILAWFITFNFINITWVFFRAKTFEDATNVLKGMTGMNGIILPEIMVKKVTILSKLGIHPGIGIFPNITEFIKTGSYIVIFLICILTLKNSNQLLKTIKPTWPVALFIIIIFVYSIINLTKVTEFLYFNF